jgi:hypothetical protein
MTLIAGSVLVSPPVAEYPSSMEGCRQCGAPVERSYRYCPWCAAPQRTKLTELFPGHPAIETSRGRALRVSRYFGDGETRHVRFSVWAGGGPDEARAEAAMSIDSAEAERLGRFLLDLPAPRETLAAELEQTQELGPGPAS